MLSRGMTSTHSFAPEAALRAACANLERRLQAGEDARAEDAFAAYPALAANAESAVDVIYVEYLARIERGQRDIADDFYARFPQWREYLRQQFEAEAILRDRAVESLPPPDPQTSDFGGIPPAGLPQQYELLGVLGSGGMGVVYKARQTSLNRIVALKVLRCASDISELARLRVEAEAVARLQHPGVVQIFEVGERNGQPFLALEYVAGGTLAKRLAGQPQPPRDAATLVAKLADAVHYAHTQGVVHRDLKPGNVLLADNSNLKSLIPKIADFGIARILDTDARQTQTGTRLGTPSYMAPEQAAGATDIGPAADVWALGAILYDCLTGRPPFQGLSALETMDQVRTREPIPPARLQSQVPRDLDTVCLMCLRKDPSQRYATAKDLADDLGRFLAGQPVYARPIGPFGRCWRWAKRRPAVAGLLLTLVLTVVGGFSGVFGQWRRAEALALAMRDERDAAEVARGRAEANDERARAVLAELAQFGGSLADQPRLDGPRQQVLEKVLNFYQKFLDDRGDDPKIRHEAAKAAQQVAWLRRLLGQIEQANAGYRQSIALYERLVADFPDRPDYRHGLAVTVRYRADMRRTNRRIAEADQDYRRSAELSEPLVAADPPLPRHQAALANTLLNWAVVLKDLNRFDEAERAYLRSIALLERATAAEPSSNYFGLELALAREDYGATLWHGLGRKAEGAALMRMAFAERARIHAAEPTSRPARHFLARSHHRLAEISGDEPAEAERHYRLAAAMREQLAKDFPGVPAYRHEWADSLAGLNVRFRNVGRWSESLTVGRQEVSLWEGLVAEYPDEVTYRQRAADSYKFVGFTLTRLGRTTEALDPLRVAQRFAPDDPTVANDLAWALVTVEDASLRDSATALSLIRKAVAARPHDIDYRNTLGVVLYRAGHNAEAIKELERCTAGRMADDPFDWLFLALAHRRLGDAAKARECFDRGARAADKVNTPYDELRRLRTEAEGAVSR